MQGNVIKSVLAVALLGVATVSFAQTSNEEELTDAEWSYKLGKGSLIQIKGALDEYFKEHPYDTGPPTREFDEEEWARGVTDFLASSDTVDDEAVAIFGAFIYEMQNRFQLRLAREQAQRELDQVDIAAENRAQGDEFLAENGTREGVQTLDSGMQIEFLEEGDGEFPVSSSTVKVHYRGTTIDGTEFDSSYSRNAPAEFPLTGVIEGWQKGIVKMRVGSKAKLYIPSTLAYGDSGAGANIGPGELLIFEVELLDIL